MASNKIYLYFMSLSFLGCGAGSDSKGDCHPNSFSIDLQGSMQVSTATLTSSRRGVTEGELMLVLFQSENYGNFSPTQSGPLRQFASASGLYLGEQTELTAELNLNTVKEFLSTHVKGRLNELEGTEFNQSQVISVPYIMTVKTTTASGQVGTSETFFGNSSMQIRGFNERVQIGKALIENSTRKVIDQPDRPLFRASMQGSLPLLNSTAYLSGTYDGFIFENEECAGPR